MMSHVGKITPPQAEALLDRRRLAWLLGESCRLTGALKAHVSRKQWLRNDGPPVCKVRAMFIFLVVQARRLEVLS